MKTFPADWTAEVCADHFLEQGWTLGGNIERSVLAWFAGGKHDWPTHGDERRCRKCGEGVLLAVDKFCVYPPPAHGRDVLVAFILQGGEHVANARQVELAKKIKRWKIVEFDHNGTSFWYILEEDRDKELESRLLTSRLPALANSYQDGGASLANLKRVILHLFSGPVEDEVCDACYGKGKFPLETWAGERTRECAKCHGSGIIPAAGVRFVKEASVSFYVLQDIKSGREISKFILDHLSNNGFITTSQYEVKEDKLNRQLHFYQKLTPEQILPPERMQ